MNQFNFPTTILQGEGALAELADRLCKKIMLVTDPGLRKAGVLDQAMTLLKGSSAEFAVYDGVHPNPIEEDVERGTVFYKENQCSSLLALGGGSAMDVAKVVRFLVVHPLPLSQYAIVNNGAKLIPGPLPPLYAVPTTAGTGSEVGRGAVITMGDTGRKTLFVAPLLMPDIAALEPALTVGLPTYLTAATGIDAFTHCLESYFAPVYHPMCDGIALEGMRLCLTHLGTAVSDGANLEARAAMQIAASMGAVAFQKDLGMIHSLAHPLSAKYGTHHGLANALMLPDSMAFLESKKMNEDQQHRVSNVRDLFSKADLKGSSLETEARSWFKELGIEFGLKQHGVSPEDIPFLTEEAFADTCHATNLIPVTRDDLAAVYTAAL